MGCINGFIIFKDIVLPFFTLLVIGGTLYIYWSLLQSSKEQVDVAKQNLKIAENQTAFNIYLSNFKLFDDLSRRKVDAIKSSEFPAFNSLTFYTINDTYKQIIYNYIGKVFEYYTRKDNRTLFLRCSDYKNTFSRFNNKIMNFIKAVHFELQTIRNDNNLKLFQKIQLIQLYSKFILSDYLELCHNLTDEKERHTNNNNYGSNELLKCNFFDKEENNLDFDIDSFMILVDDVNVNYLLHTT
ncbi:MAG: hypothetical protein ABSG89_11375 [Bacteroidales bacterium]|jgi:hypothetical protein